MRSLTLAILIAFASVPAMADDSEKTAKAEIAENAAKEYKPPPGYKTRHRGDKTIYCSKTTEIGTRFPVEKCFSQEQLKVELARIAEQKEEFDRRRRVCSNPAVCASN